MKALAQPSSRCPATALSSRPPRRCRTGAVIAGLAVLLAITLALPSNAATLAKTLAVGTNPGQIVVDPAYRLAWVVNRGSNTVSVIDLKTLAVTATVPVGASPTGIAVDPTTHTAYVANSGSGTVTSISNGSSAATLTVGGAPSAVVHDASSTYWRLYVMDTTQSRIDTYWDSSGTSGYMPLTLQPVAMTFNVNTRMLFVACSGAASDAVVVIDDSPKIVKTIAVAKGSTSISVDPLTNIVVVESPSTNTHTVINAGNGYTKKTQTLSAPFASTYGGGRFFVTLSNHSILTLPGDTGLFGPGDVYFSPLTGAGGLAFNPLSDQMAVLYPQTDNAVLINATDPLDPVVNQKLTAGSEVAGAAFDPLTSRLLISNAGSNTVSIFDTNPNRLVDAYEDAYGATNIAGNSIDSNPATGDIYTLRLGKVYVTNEAGASAGADGNSQNRAGVATIPLASTASHSLAVNIASNKIYAGDGPDRFYSIDGATNAPTLVSGLPAGTDIRSMAMDYGSNHLWAWDYPTGNVLVLDGASGALLMTVPTADHGNGVLQVDDFTGLVYFGGVKALYAINRATGAIVSTTPLPATVTGAAIDTVNSRLFVIDSGGHLTALALGSSPSIQTTIPLSATSVAVNPPLKRFYAAGSGQVHEYVYDTNALVRTWSTTANPLLTGTTSLLVNPLTNTVYVGTDSASSTSTLAVIDGATGRLSGIAPLFDDATHALTLDPVSGVVGGAGYSYTQLVFPPPSNPGYSAAINVNFYSSSTIATAPIFRAKAGQAINAEIAVTPGAGTNGIFPQRAYYQLDGQQGHWSGGTLQPSSEPDTVVADFNLTKLGLGLHILYVFANYNDLGTVQVGLPAGNSVANSPQMYPIAAFVFTVEL